MRELRALTALRGLAAMAVVLQHFSTTAQHHASTTIPSLVPHGYMAVDFFFVLSGFIMCYTYLAAFEQGVPGAYGDFLAKRVARILPLNVAVVLAIALAGGLSTALIGRNLYYDPTRIWIDLPGNLLMLQSFGIGRPWNGPAWSVSMECAAYLLFPLLVMLVFHRHRAVRLLTLAAAIAALGSLVFAAREIAQDVSPFMLGLLRCLGEFTLGMFTFALLRRGALGFIGSDESVMLLIGGIGLTLILRQDLPALALFPFLVLAGARNQGIAERVLGSPVPYFLGVVSYSLYMIHNTMREPLLLLLRWAHPQPLSTLPALTMALLGGLLVVPVAALAYATVERPGRAWVRALFGARARLA